MKRLTLMGPGIQMKVMTVGKHIKVLALTMIYECEFSAAGVVSIQTVYIET